MIKGLIIETNEQPEIIDFEPELDVMRELVAGDIQEVYPFDDSVVLICNENGKNYNLPKNRHIKEINDTIYGAFLIIGDDGGEDYISLTNEQISYYKNLFSL